MYSHIILKGVVNTTKKYNALHITFIHVDPFYCLLSFGIRFLTLSSWWLAKTSSNPMCSFALWIANSCKIFFNKKVEIFRLTDLVSHFSLSVGACRLFAVVLNLSTQNIPGTSVGILVLFWRVVHLVVPRR